MNLFSSIEEILTAENISWKAASEHEAVSDSCIGICCPYCLEDNFHCGVFQENGNFYCWKCLKKGTFFQLLSKLKIPKRRRGIYAQTAEHFLFSVPKKPKIDFELPEGIVEVDYLLLKDHYRLAIFLASKGIDIRIAEDLGLMFGTEGAWYQRLIFPVVYKGKVETIIGRDITGKAIKKYYAFPGINIKNFVYGYDEAKFRSGVLFLVEGIFDKLELGANSVALFGKDITAEQILKLVEIQPDEIVIALDGDTGNTEKKNMISSLNPFFSKIKCLFLPKEEDPFSLGAKAIYQLYSKEEFIK